MTENWGEAKVGHMAVDQDAQGTSPDNRESSYRKKIRMCGKRVIASTGDCVYRERVPES